MGLNTLQNARSQYQPSDSDIICEPFSAVVFDQKDVVWCWARPVSNSCFLLVLLIIRSTSESRPNSIEGKNVRPPVRTSVRPYVRPSTKSLFNLNEIWYIGRGRWVMHEVCRMAGSKVKVTSPSKFEFLPFSKSISSAIYNGSWQMITNS